MSAQPKITDESAIVVLRRLLDGMERGEYEAPRAMRRDLRQVLQALETLDRLPQITVGVRLR